MFEVIIFIFPTENPDVPVKAKEYRTMITEQWARVVEDYGLLWKQVGSGFVCTAY